MPWRIQPILLVEDEPMICDLLAEALREEGFGVTAVSDGQSALNALQQEKPCLLVLDMGLPLVGGVAVAHEADGLYAGTVPILVITADGSAQEKAREAGATALLDKPFDLVEFLDAVYRLVGRSQGHEYAFHGPA